VNTEEVNPHLTTQIVVSYVRHHRLGPDQLSDLITSVHRAIGQLGQPVQPEEILIPAVSVRRSVHRDYVICLDCGYRGKTLRRHISTRHGINRDEYLKRWGLRSDHPLTSPAYSERRSTLAKSLGLGRKAPVETAPPVTPTAAQAATDAIAGNSKVKRTRKSRPPPKSESAASETAARPTPARKKQPRARVASPSVSGRA
jgi:predicted transcriptional regulator